MQLFEGVSFLNNFYLVSVWALLEVKYEQKFIHFQDLRVERHMKWIPFFFNSKVQNGRLHLHQILIFFLLRIKDTEAKRVANFDVLRVVYFWRLIKDREFIKISSRKWNIGLVLYW